MSPVFPSLPERDLRDLARNVADFPPTAFWKMDDPAHAAKLPNHKVPDFCKSHQCNGAEIAAFCFIGTAALGFHNIAAKIAKTHKHWAFDINLPVESFHSADAAIMRMGVKPVVQVHALHALAVADGAPHQTVERDYRATVGTVLDMMARADAFGRVPNDYLAGFRANRVVNEARQLAQHSGQFIFQQELKRFERTLDAALPPQPPLRGNHTPIRLFPKNEL